MKIEPCCDVACMCMHAQVITQVALVLLLFGTVIGDFALLADVGQRALRQLSPAAPEILVGHDGRGVMVALVLCVVFPLCLLRRHALWPLAIARHFAIYPVIFLSDRRS